MIKEMVVISGKGGTGKTSIVASFAALSGDKVIADCDVDAADLFLILSPTIIKEEEFVGGKVALVNKEKCTECGECHPLCRFEAISDEFDIDPIACEGCGVCAYFCNCNAIVLKEKIAGKWFVSDTKYGRLVHARLGIAEDNSGKLVSVVRKEAQRIAEENRYNLIIVDGPPGIGCPVIASITGTSLILVVTEPTVSGLHDMKRVLELSSHFGIKAIVCINKYDLNKENAQEIEDFCKKKGVEIAAKIPYDVDFTRAQLESLSIVEYSDGPASVEVRKMWETISENML